MKNKIIKRHSDGSVTTLGEAFKAVSKGTIVGVVVGATAVLAGLGAAVLADKSLLNKN